MTDSYGLCEDAGAVRDTIIEHATTRSSCAVIDIRYADKPTREQNLGNEDGYVVMAE